MLKRWYVINRGLYILACLRVYKRLCRSCGEYFKRIGRALVRRGEENVPQWSRELLLKCYLVDAELHLGLHVYRGPIYAVYRNFKGGDFLVLCFNWIEQRLDSENLWVSAGACDFRIEKFGEPHALLDVRGRETGNRYFMCDGGYGVLWIGEKSEVFKGQNDTPRIYAYF